MIYDDFETGCAECGEWVWVSWQHRDTPVLCSSCRGRGPCEFCDSLDGETRWEVDQRGVARRSGVVCNSCWDDG